MEEGVYLLYISYVHICTLGTVESPIVKAPLSKLDSIIKNVIKSDGNKKTVIINIINNKLNAHMIVRNSCDEYHYE